MLHSISILSLLLVITGFSKVSGAEDKPYIAVGTAKIKKTVLAFPSIQTPNDASQASIAKTIQETVTQDLLFMDLFSFLGVAAFLEKTGGVAPNTFKLSDWSSNGSDFLLKAALHRDGVNLALESYVYESKTGKPVLAKRFLAAPSEVKTLAHTFANQIVETLTGLPGIFLTKVAFVCDHSSKKEIYMSNFDGTDVKQVTHHRSLAFAPTWSPDGTRIAYSLYTRHKGNIKNIDLYEFDFKTSTYRMLSNRNGINSGAAYHPNGKTIALTMSFLGDPEIFTFDPETKTVSRLTKSMGFDVDPSWSPDGKKVAFVSSRVGPAMVFSMNANGENVQRLTYAGKFNATPSWSPQNNKIAFAGWLDNKFDIFTMDPDGSHIERLTKNQGNNEDPHFSPDGNFLVFSSNRTGQSNIYAMNSDGTFVKRLTFGLGNCVAPRWSGVNK